MQSLTSPRNAHPITITIGENELALDRWTSLRISRGIERFPSDFEFTVSPQAEGEILQDVRPAQPVVIRVGNMRLLTGYIDRCITQVTAESHSLQISGRSRCLDLVDCSAEIEKWHGYKLKSDIKSLAEELCSPYGITVTDRTSGNPQFETFSVNLGETPYEILERVSRSVGVLLYDDVDGNLVLGRSLADGGGGPTPLTAAVLGANVKALSRMGSADTRYRTYSVVAQSVDSLSDGRAEAVGVSGASTAPGAAGAFIRGEATDFGVDERRNRHLYIIGEQWQGAQSLAQKRADWEANRRWGRSQAVSLVMRDWLSDSEAGIPWEPNIPLEIIAPQVGLVQSSRSGQGQDWVVASVTYSQDLKSGLTVELMAMPRQAFLIEPVGIRSQTADLTEEASRNALRPGVQGPQQ